MVFYIRFKDTSDFQDIFDETVLQAISHRMVGGRVFTDSTHVKANVANKHQYTKEQVRQNTRDYLDELIAAVEAEHKPKESELPITLTVTRSANKRKIV